MGQTLDGYIEQQDVLRALRTIAALSDLLGDIAGDVCEIGARETRLTQRKMAEALGVPPSTLRGLKASIRG